MTNERLLSKAASTILGGIFMQRTVFTTNNVTLIFEQCEHLILKKRNNWKTKGLWSGRGTFLLKNDEEQLTTSDLFAKTGVFVFVSPWHMEISTFLNF